MENDEQLAKEARDWDEGRLTPAGWQNAPDAVPRSRESVSISVCLPAQMVTLLREFARRAGIGEQALIAQWLDDRIRHEAERRTPVGPG